MKILHTVEFYHPSIGGAQEVVRQISEQLVERGHQVTVATTRLSERAARRIKGVQIEEFNISGNAVRGFQGETKAYQGFLRSVDVDLMMNYAAQQWATDLALPLLDSLPYRKVLAPCGFSGLYDPAYASYFAQLPDSMRRYDHLVFHSNEYRDIDFARRHELKQVTVIPNGASLGEFENRDETFRERYGISPNEPLLLTVGSHTGWKGHAAVMEAFRRAGIGAATLVIVGNTLGSPGCLPSCRRRAVLVRILTFGRKKVLLLDPPRKDIVAAYQAADLFVFASEIECSPIVLFEAAASKTAFITVPCGNAEEIVKWTGGGVVTAPDPGLFARAIEELLEDSQKRATLAESGQRAWQQNFTWEKIATQYEALYSRLIDSRNSSDSCDSLS